ncbi:hypothetical protein [Thermus sp.]|uniref:hypothetical protein n=1 Tax=Thermus sp. TaxID=275 RepID=UPI003D0B88C9
MRGLSGFLALLSLALAQTVSLPKPEGPVVEVVAPNANATFKIQGCARDQEGKVVCAVQIQSNARTNQQLTVLHQSVRAISARGFTYPGYLSVEGGQVEASRSVFSLAAGNRASGKLIFPQVPKEETFFAAIYVGGLEFRGIPIGQAPAPQVQAATPQSQGASTPPAGAWDYKRFTVGPFTFELQSGPKVVCSVVDCWFSFEYTVTASQDAELQMRFDQTRTITEGGLQTTRGGFRVSGGRSDFLAGIPLRVTISLPANLAQPEQIQQILYTEFEVFDGKDWQRVVFRNVPIQK